MRLLLILFIFSGCGNDQEVVIDKSKTPLKIHDSIDTDRNQQTSDSGNLQWEQDRIEKMFVNFSNPVEEIENIPSVETINALYGKGYKVKNEPIKFMIYVFDNQRQHSAARNFFEEQINYDSTKSIMASNGSLFFFGETTSDKKEAYYLLNELVSVFAGEE